MVYLHGIGHFHPENVITNTFLESLDIGTTVDWIMERVGIETRRTVLPLDYLVRTKNADPRETDKVRLYSDAQMGGKAARMALTRAGLKVEDIGMVISGSSLPQYLTPADASTVACDLGIDVPCFDINSACGTYGVQMCYLDSVKPEKLPPYILVTNIEASTTTIDYSDRRSAVLFGDCATASILSATAPSNKTFSDCKMASKPTMWNKAVVPRWGYFHQDGNAVQGYAIRKTTDGLRNLLASAPKADRNRFFFIGHQANLGVLETAAERSGVSPKNHWYNVHRFGNVGCAGGPSVLSQHWDDLRGGDHVAMSIVGAGLTWTQMLLTIK
jgi:3-oxoacyl-[acyl-carrier-protein] synthase III